MGQKVSLYQGLSLRENVEFYAGLYGLAGGELERRWGELRERFAPRARPRASGPRTCPPASASARAWRWRRCIAPRVLLPRRADRRASTCRAAASSGSCIQEEPRRRRHGLRHDALPRGSRLLRPGRASSTPGRLIADATPEGAAPRATPSGYRIRVDAAARRALRALRRRRCGPRASPWRSGGDGVERDRRGSRRRRWPRLDDALTARRGARVRIEQTVDDRRVPPPDLAEAARRMSWQRPARR